MFWITAILGVALGVAPWILGYAGHVAAMWTSVILGLVVFIASAAGLIARPPQERWEYWAIGLAALAAFVAPFVLGYSDHAEPLWTALILGATLLLLDAFELFRAPKRVEPPH